MNKNVLITGASRGIGKAIAIEFAKQGYNIAINSSKSRDALHLTANQIANKYNVKCIPIVADVSNFNDVKRMFDIFSENFDKIDILINNAGIAHYGLLVDLKPNEWQNIINTNLTSIYNTCHFAVDKMLKKHYGNIINISSIWGEVGASCEVAYSASKGGMNAFTKALAKELALSNIRVNTLSCGVIDTEMNSNLSNDDKKALIGEIPMNRLGTPEEIAKLCVYLVSDNAKYITGQIIRVDGGFANS